MATINSEEYIRKRKMYKRIGWICVGLFIFNLIDSETPIPFGFKGWLGIYIGLGFLLPGLVLLFLAYRIPSVRMIEQVAIAANGWITASLLIHHLDINLDQAEQLIKTLFKKGILDIKNRVTDETPIGQWLCIFVGVSKVKATTDSTAARDENLNLADYTKSNPLMNAQDINQALLNNSLDIGQSGQPVRRRR